jgi:mono/diheme cytochrome c family protein
VRTLRGALAVLGATMLVAGCGTSGYQDATEGDPSAGKQLFIDGCGSCHTLADAGTKGTVGPNLDDAFARARHDGMGEATIRQVVRQQIAYPVVEPPSGDPGMPANIYTGDEAADVAAYVASVAGVNRPSSQGQGGESETEGADGAAIFASAGCSACHTLAAANASGTVGPNLDETRPTKELAVDRITNGRGAMPPFKDSLTAEQIDAVATFVAENAGK